LVPSSLVVGHAIRKGKGAGVAVAVVAVLAAEVEGEVAVTGSMHERRKTY
jgi:hypothetical protein